MKNGLGGKITKISIILGAIALAMVFTNPRKEKYLAYASSKLAADIQAAACTIQTEKDASNFLPGLPSLLSSLCKKGVNLSQSFVKVLIDRTTTQQDLILFSIYTTELPNRTYKTIAAFGNFYTYN